MRETQLKVICTPAPSDKCFPAAWKMGISGFTLFVPPNIYTLFTVRITTGLASDSWDELVPAKHPLVFLNAGIYVHITAFLQLIWVDIDLVLGLLSCCFLLMKIILLVCPVLITGRVFHPIVWRVIVKSWAMRTIGQTGKRWQIVICLSLRPCGREAYTKKQNIRLLFWKR